MSTPLIVWSLIVGLFIVVLIARLYHVARLCPGHREKLLGFMTEREEFYIPGDPNPRKTDEYDYED